ncbi:MAG: dNTP triphosphohydrolase [Planctomycetes bacterium]|nr:dNTP triphosphohydrolase [Planctomycetota bacterium]
MSTSSAEFAVHDNASRGRVWTRAEVGDERPFDLDRHRIISCMAFRRLMYKTQVFITGTTDHFRTRMSHTLEVMAQAERLARLVGVNDRLAGAVALAHDLGHSPFGHAGEKQLAQLMKGHGGFEHNVQSLRVVDYLEHPYPAFRGLNLSFEVRESLIKHQTKYDHPTASKKKDDPNAALFEVGPRCPIEGQIANVADMVAYTLHDIEDGLGQGVLTEEHLSASRLWREAAEPIRSQHPDKTIHALRRPIIDRLAARFNEDARADDAGADRGGGDSVGVGRAAREGGCGGVFGRDAARGGRVNDDYAGFGVSASQGGADGFEGEAADSRAV